LPTRRALRIASQIGAALDAAHARGLVHRDVKPANILVTADDRAYLSDFGVVKELSSNGTTRTGSFIGTIEYCAPEQIEGREVDARTDVYALACVLYECLAGKPPFHRPSEVAVLNAHLHAPPPKLSRAAPDVPPALEHVISKALSKSPLDRYAGCGEFVNAARAAASERRVHGRRLAISVSLLVLAALIGAVIALAVRSVAFGGDGSATPPPRPPQQPQSSLSQLLLRSNDGRTLNDIAYALIGAREYDQALPFARKAVRKAPAGSLTRGFANFNLGYTLLKLGQCAKSLPPLRTSLKLEPPVLRPYIRPRIKQAQRCVQHAASSPARSR
jgi:serine/threonine protein kinase